MTSRLSQIEPFAKELVEIASARGLSLATAESCTGGLIAVAITEIAGSSAVLDRGFVTYSNEAKSELLGVPPELINAKGAVSEEVARAMAIGVLSVTNVDFAVSVTGIAGPGGGSAEKPVGLVHIAAAKRNGPILHTRYEFEDKGRASIRTNSAIEALKMLLDLLQD